MATNGKNKKRSRLSLFGKKESEEMRETVKQFNDKTSQVIDGVATEFRRESDDEFEEMQNTIKSVTDIYKTITGDNLIEFFTQHSIDEDNTRRKIAGRAFDKKQNSIRKALEDPNKQNINDLYTNEKSRINKIPEYDQVVNYIPQLNQALNVLVDNIMSPDDFTKDVFTLKYNGETVVDDTNDHIIRNLYDLEKIYNIEGKTKRIITDTLKYGDTFLSIVKMNDGLDKIFTEDGELISFNEDTVLLNESNLLLSENDEKRLLEFYKEETGNKKGYEGNIRADIARMINENITFSSNPLNLYKEELLLEADFNTERFKYVSSKYDDEMTKKAMRMNASQQNRSLAQKITDRRSLFSTENPLAKELEKEANRISDSEKNARRKQGYVTGSFVKLLDPRKVVKIYSNGTCYGYYHLETELESLKVTNNSNATQIASAFQVKSGADIGNSSDGMFNQKKIDPKTQLILDVFLKNISKKLNKRFIENSPEFKQMLYQLLQQDYIVKNKVNITYLSPDEVEHFSVNMNEDDGYGRSVFDRILFTAKIYLATLTTTLMLKLSRSADHRTFIVETGLSNDLEGIIQDFVREIKSKEVTMSDLNSIDTILNNIGQFADYFIPSIDGQRAIDIDVTPGQQIDMDNDLMEYLKKAMISGMGIPASFLSYADEMEFARSVSMMNGMFLRMIVGYQKSLGDAFSNTYRKLYRNEYGKAEENTEEENKATLLDYDLIEAIFPSPATLNMTNLNEQIGSSQTVVEYVVNTLIGASEQNEDKRDFLTREVTKDIMTNIDWSHYEEILDRYRVEKVEIALKRDLENGVGNGANDMGMGGGMPMDQGMDMGMGDDMGMEGDMGAQPPMDQGMGGGMDQGGTF